MGGPISGFGTILSHASLGAIWTSSSPYTANPQAAYSQIAQTQNYAISNQITRTQNNTLPYKFRDVHNIMLVTERLRIYQITHAIQPTLDRIKTIVGWLNDPEVIKFSEQRLMKHTEATQWEYFTFLMDDPDRSYWTICLHGDPESDDDGRYRLIGSITADFNKRNDAANLGIMIGDKSCWGHGYGIEAMAAIINHLSGEGVRRFEIGTMKENERMIKLATACGMVKEREGGGYVYMAAEIGGK